MWVCDQYPPKADWPVTLRTLSYLMQGNATAASLSPIVAQQQFWNDVAKLEFFDDCKAPPTPALVEVCQLTSWFCVCLVWKQWLSRLCQLLG